MKNVVRDIGRLFAQVQRFVPFSDEAKGEIEMAGDGRAMCEGEIKEVISLLASTELSVTEISQRMSCTKNAVVAINRKFQVRAYTGLRSSCLMVGRENSPATSLPPPMPLFLRVVMRCINKP